MRKMQCEVCGSISIKKVADNLFECQSCGVQYDTTEVKKLLAEITGEVKIDHSDEVENTIKRAEQFEESGNDTKAAEYYHAALDLDADNEVAQKRAKEIADQQELKNYYVIEPDVDPQDNVRHFFEQLATTENIACDIYKEIAIRSVTETYMTFYFMKAKYRCDWSATACHVYYENETVYEKKYDANRKCYVKEPVTKQVKKVNRVPQSGTHLFDTSELVLASDSLKGRFTAETETLKCDLIAAFEAQQDNKYGTYKTQRINPRDVRKEDGNFFYKGMALDAQTDKRIYIDRSKKMADAAWERAEPDVLGSIGGDYYENLNAVQHVISESVAYVCVPVQIIDYTYKGKDYVALSDLLSHTTTMPQIYPCDTEMASAMKSLETQKEESEKTPGVMVGLGMMAGAFICGLLGAFIGEDEIFVPLCLALMVLGLGFMLAGLLIQHRRKKTFKNSAEEIKRTLFDPRVEALEATKKRFFKDYTDYASAQNAAANARCMAIKQTTPAVSGADAIRKKMAYITSEAEGDNVTQTLEDGIKRLQKRRNIGILATLIGGAVIGVFSVMLLDAMPYLHSIISAMLVGLAVAGFGLAMIGSIVILGNKNKRIIDLRAATQAYMIRKQLREEYENPQEHEGDNAELLAFWTEDRIESAIAQLDEKGNGRKITALIAGIIAAVIFLTFVLESSVCRISAYAYERELIGKTYTSVDSSAIDTYRFNKRGKYEETVVYLNEAGVKTNTRNYSGSYRMHYDMVSGDCVLVIDSGKYDVSLAGKKTVSFRNKYDTFYESTDESVFEDDDVADTEKTTSRKQTTAKKQTTTTAKDIEEEQTTSKVQSTTKQQNTTDKHTTTTQQAVVCAHRYENATCDTPQTCTLCGHTVGVAAGHSWTQLTQEIYHEEQGHYEEVQDEKKVNKYRCWLCGYSKPLFATLEEYYAHFDSGVHATAHNYSAFRERYEIVERWEYETVTKWVVDSEAYTETVVVGRRCDTCGSEEQ